MMYDALIIGAGVSGLAAGIRLAYFDRRVCIVEQHSAIGGLNSYYRLRGRNFDVGLHAITNFVTQEARFHPLPRLLRQLRLNLSDWHLAPQTESVIAFPDVQLRFSNEPELLFSEVARAFPGQQDALRRLVDALLDYNQWESPAFALSARQRLAELIDEPLLREMLLCPVMWYGNSRQGDMDWGQFCILFRSIFLEGLARPAEGIRLILRTLVRRYRSLGGELRLRSAVRRVCIEQQRAVGVELANGEFLPAQRILSSAGWCETLQLCGLPAPADELTGRLSFLETIALLDRPCHQWGHHRTMVFFNEATEFRWENPAEKLCDLHTGVICAPENFRYSEQEQSHVQPSIRVTVLANYQAWSQLPADQYYREKAHWQNQILDKATRWTGDFRPFVVDTDTFTPKTIHHYTWHLGGAVYGSPRKHLDGRTPVPNVFICGTDQGLVGIVGAMTSGVTIANRYCLQDA
jgi:phytoene dehydrogenase-like protein